jgi:hypothetical protein
MRFPVNIAVLATSQQELYTNAYSTIATPNPHDFMISNSPLMDDQYFLTMAARYLIAICCFLSTSRSLVVSFTNRNTGFRGVTVRYVLPEASDGNAPQTDDEDEVEALLMEDSRASSSGIKDLTRRQAFVVSAVCASHLVSPARSAVAYNDEEAKRIAVFEKTSPSVVFIDTFAERRDVFSTNILEGNGSPGELRLRPTV